MAAQLAVNLDRSQVEVEVISMYPRQGHIYEKKVEDAGVPIHYLDKQGHASLGAMVRLWKLLSELKPDVVHTHIYAGFYTIPWVLAHRAVQLHTVHNHPQTEFPYLLRQFMWLCSKTGKLKYATISKMNQQLCCEYYHASPERFPYVNNPVETERFYHREEPTGEIRFISVGRLEPRKNQILAIRAMPEVLRQVPNAKLVLLGDGEDRAMLEGEADTLGVRDAVVFAGNQPKPEDLWARPFEADGRNRAYVEAEAGLFACQLERYRVCPEVFMIDSEMRVLQDASAHLRKYIVGGGVKVDLYDLNLERRAAGASLLDMGVEAAP